MNCRSRRLNRVLDGIQTHLDVGCFYGDLTVLCSSSTGPSAQHHTESYVYVHLASMFDYVYDKLPAAFFDPVPLGTHEILKKFKRPIALFCFVHPPRGAPLNRPSAVFSTSASSLTILGGGQLKTATQDKSISHNFAIQCHCERQLDFFLAKLYLGHGGIRRMRPREDQTLEGGRTSWRICAGYLEIL